AINASQSAVVASANSLSVTGAAIGGNGAIAANAFQINGVNVGAVADGGSAAGQATNVAAAINLVSAATGVTASVPGAGNDQVKLTTTDGRDIVVAGTVTNTGLTAATTHGTFTLTASSPTTNVGITIGGSAPASAGLTAGTTAGSVTGTAVSN